MTESAASPVRVEPEAGGRVVRVWLDRPDVRNAMNGTLIRALRDAFAAIAADPAVRVAVLGGRGKAFCAGADLGYMREMAGYTWEQNRADAEVLADMLWTVRSCPVPTVARIHGDCYAGGMGLAAVCDVRVASEGVTFCLSEARLGLLPATISPYVVAAMGESQARRWFTTAERFGAPRAREMGFVHECVAAEALDATVEGLVAALAANGPAATRACKRLVDDVAGRPVDAALRAETARRIADIRATDEGREGIASFLEKRAPGWNAA
jgi:methylglutaconyl-CoA hydratase